MWHCTLHMCICLLFFSRSILSVKSTSSLSVKCLMKNFETLAHLYSVTDTVTDMKHVQILWIVYCLTTRRASVEQVAHSICISSCRINCFGNTRQNPLQEKKYVLNHGNVTSFHFLSISLFFAFCFRSVCCLVRCTFRVYSIIMWKSTYPFRSPH